MIKVTNMLFSLQVKNNQVSLNLEKNSVYTLTTVTKGHKGFYVATAKSKPFPLPYQDNFDCESFFFFLSV